MALDLPPLGRAACRPLPSPPFVAGASPRWYAFGRGRGAAPGAGCSLLPAGEPGGGGGEGRPVSRPPGRVAGGLWGRGVALPRSIPLPSLGW